MNADGPGRRAIDPRPARTREAIRRAVLDLAAGSEEVSVNAIVRAAGIARSSFYAQFTDLDELATALLVELFEQIGVDDLADRSADRPDARAIARRAASRLVEHVQERRPFYRATLDWKLSAQTHHVLVAAYAEQVAASMAVIDGIPAAADHADAALFIGGGAIALLTRWLRDDDPVSTEAMTERLLAVMPEWLVGAGQRTDVVPDR